MICCFQILEVLCKQNLITSGGLSHRTAWCDTIPTYTLSHGLLVVSCIEKTIQFYYCEQDFMKQVFECEKATL